MVLMDTSVSRSPAQSSQLRLSGSPARTPNQDVTHISNIPVSRHYRPLFSFFPFLMFLFLFLFFQTSVSCMYIKTYLNIPHTLFCSAI
jgi:hypothetical protein